MKNLLKLVKSMRYEVAYYDPMNGAKNNYHLIYDIPKSGDIRFRKFTGSNGEASRIIDRTASPEEVSRLYEDVLKLIDEADNDESAIDDFHVTLTIFTDNSDMTFARGLGNNQKHVSDLTREFLESVGFSDVKA